MSTARRALQDAKHLARQSNDVALVFHRATRKCDPAQAYFAVLERNVDPKYDDCPIAFAVWPDGVIS